VLEDRVHIVLALVRQRARSREHFDDADEAQEEEYHPDDLVSLKQIPNLYIHLSTINHKL
jgi:hypothetical protein